MPRARARGGDGWGITGGAGGTIVGGSITLDGGAGGCHCRRRCRHGAAAYQWEQRVTWVGATLAHRRDDQRRHRGGLNWRRRQCDQRFTSTSAAAFTLGPAGRFSISGGGATINHPAAVTVNG